MVDAHVNFAYTTVTVAPSPATTGTTLTVGAGITWPTPPFNCTVWPSGVQPLIGNAEIVRVTANASNVFTIVRNQESSVTQSILVGYQIAATITAKTLTDAEFFFDEASAFPDNSQFIFVVQVVSNVLLPTSTYNNGASGVGATITASANGQLVIDGYTLLVGDNVLIIGVLPVYARGVYVVTQTGDVTHPFILTRHFRYQTGAQFVKAIVVTSGSGGATLWGMMFQCTNNTAPIIGTDSINFIPISGNLYLNLTSSALTTSYNAGVGTLSLTPIASNSVIANISGISAEPSGATLTALIDAALGTTQGDVLFRNATAWTVLPPGTNGQCLMTQGASADPVWEANPAIFGTGADGALSISSGTTTLTRDMHYTNVTISGTAILNPNGFRIYGTGILDITSASAGSIRIPTVNGLNGSGATAGLGAGAVALGTVPWHAGNGGTGATGGTGVGPASVAIANAGIVFTLGGSGGVGGTGGAGVSAGGLGGTVGTNGANFILSTPTLPVFFGATCWAGAVQPSGGGAGGGDGTNLGGGGAGGGTCNSMLYIAFNIINRGGSTAVGCFNAKGSNGGIGGTAPTGNCGGGGGGGGAGGGSVYIVCNALTGSTATNAIDVSGGTGGLGGNGIGTGIGGTGGKGGACGNYFIIILGLNTFATGTANTAGSTGSAGSGTTGGAGGAGNTLQANL